VAQADGTETIVELQPHPESEGENGTDGTVEQYFESQGAAPMMAAARRYHALLGRVMDLLAAQGEIADTESSDSNKVVSLVDVDPAVEEHCAKLKLALPEDPWIKMEIHIAAVNDWLDTFDA
jgi:predicted RNA methylase